MNESPTDGAEQQRLDRVDQIMRDLGWDAETSAAMAAARHAADPGRYPTLESATYVDPPQPPVVRGQIGGSFIVQLDAFGDRIVEVSASGDIVAMASWRVLVSPRRDQLTDIVDVEGAERALRASTNAEWTSGAAALAETSRRWSEWAANASTDTVPDRYIGEPMPDGTLATRPWWYHPDGTLRDAPPDDEEGRGNEFTPASPD